MVFRKLISHIYLINKGIETLWLKNTEFYNSTADRRVKKKKKCIVLFVKSVFTTKSANVLINAKEAANKAK